MTIEENQQIYRQALDGALCESLSPEDPLHPDNYNGPYGSLWEQAVIWALAAEKEKRDS